MSDIEHFLLSEIYMCQKRKDDPSIFYDGVKVGYKQAKKLNDNHIAFCRHLLNLIEDEQECEKCIKENTEKVNK